MNRTNAMTSTTERPGVVVGVDGTPNSIAALRHAAMVAAQRDAVLDVVHAVGRDERDTCSQPVALARGWAILEGAAASVPETHPAVAVRRHLVSGDSAGVLIRFARGAALLVLGARTDPEHARPLGGSTIPAVIDASPCEVLVCADHSLATHA
jgi:nucleotide-binding universal stress UspA family protein